MQQVRERRRETRRDARSTTARDDDANAMRLLAGR
jgi:hypothetical protein